MKNRGEQTINGRNCIGEDYATVEEFEYIRTVGNDKDTERETPNRCISFGSRNKTAFKISYVVKGENGHVAVILICNRFYCFVLWFNIFSLSISSDDVYFVFLAEKWERRQEEWREKVIKAGLPILPFT